jgi:hypothetical protein
MATLQEVLQERDKGTVVNPHVVTLAAQPRPDYEAMQRTIENTSLKQDKERRGDEQGRREVSKN